MIRDLLQRSHLQRKTEMFGTFASVSQNKKQNKTKFFKSNWKSHDSSSSGSSETRKRNRRRWETTQDGQLYSSSYAVLQRNDIFG